MRASLLGRFLWRSVGWLLCWTLLWSVLADGLTAPLALLADGVTTVEVKSGYGLDLATELDLHPRTVARWRRQEKTR